MHLSLRGISHQFQTRPKHPSTVGCLFDILLNLALHPGSEFVSVVCHFHANLLYYELMAAHDSFLLGFAQQQVARLRLEL